MQLRGLLTFFRDINGLKDEPIVTEHYQAEAKFEVGSARSFSDIQFRKGTLVMPPLRIQKSTGSFFFFFFFESSRLIVASTTMFSSLTVLLTPPCLFSCLFGME